MRKDHWDYWDREPKDLASILSHKLWHAAPRFIFSEPDFSTFPSFTALSMSPACAKILFPSLGGVTPISRPVVSCKLSHDQNPTDFCLPVKAIMENNLGALPGQEALSSHPSARPQEGTRTPWGVGLVCILDNMVIILSMKVQLFLHWNHHHLYY